MGYFTYRLFKGVACDRVERKVRANLALYEPGTVGRTIQVSLFDGRGCSAILMGYLNREESVLMPIGYQLGCIWMDVRYQDGDSWSLSIHEGPEHRVSHNVNPWANGEKCNQEHVDYRIRRICEFWPEHAARIERYLLPWRESVVENGRTGFVPRKGKAYETDRCGYGDADQINDFIAAFGVNEQTLRRIVRGDECA